MFNFFLRITMCLLFLLLRKEKPEFSASSLQAWSISSLLYLLWLTNKSITSFPSESLSLYICNKTSKSSGISEFLSSFWKCKTEVMSSSDWLGAMASANHCSSFCCNLSNFWCSFCFVLPFRSVIFFFFILYARRPDHFFENSLHMKKFNQQRIDHWRRLQMFSLF